MMNRTGWLLLCAPLATAGMLLPIMTTGGCQNDSGGGGSGNIGNVGNTGGSGNTGNTGGSGNTGNTGNTGGTGGGQTACGVATTPATIQDITTGAVGTGVDVTVTGAVVMSQKYLVTTSGSGNCLWGVFVSAPGLQTTAANTGILAVSYGNPATIPDGGTKAYCPKIDDNSAVTGDAIPDQVQPGDVVTIIGTTDKFLLDNCLTEDAGAAVGQFQIAQVCSMTVTQSGGPVPALAVISGADLAKLSSPTDTAFHDQWGGVKVRIAPASAQPSGVGGGNSVVGDYGIITLDQNDIQVNDGIYYRGYQKSNPCYAGPVFDGPMSWTSIDGFCVLDYCTWGLAVNDKCSDFVPQSTDCVVATCAPY